MYSALAQLEGRKAQNQTRNGQLCSRSHTTQPRYILESHTENMVRPQRRGATDSYEQKRPSPPESVALDPPLHHTKIPADCYKITPVHWSQTGGNGRQWVAESCWQKRHKGLLQWNKGRRDLFTWDQHMEWRPSLTARELWQDGVNTSRSYATSLAT